jgi:hypothetical protein
LGTNSAFALGPRKTTEILDRVGQQSEECRHLGYKIPVRTSQETHSVSTTEPNRLMLFGETVAVYCENRTEHIIRCVGTSVRTSQETHYASATEPNRLMLFGETVAVYCKNRTEHTLCGQS